MGILDMIIEIIYFNSILNLTDDFRMNSFYEMLYNLLRISMMEYRPNELYASQWLDFIRKMAFEKRKEEGLNLALTELIDNNEKILTSRITSGMIESFVEKLNSQETVYLNLIKAILISDGKAMFRNQMILNDILFKVQSNRDLLLFQMRKNPKTEIIEIKN